MNIISPMKPSSEVERRLIRVGWLLVGLVIWLIFKPLMMPDPIQIIATLPSLFNDQGLRDALISSGTTSLEAILISIGISGSLAFGRKITAVEPLADGLAYLRFLSPACFFALLLFALKSGSAAKMGMLVLGESFFLTAALNKIVDGIPSDLYDEAKVLRMSPWQQLWYVTVRQSLPQAFEAVQDVMAMGWAMLPMVEGAIRSEGGVGVLILNQERYMNFDAVYGIALCVLLIGIGQDYLISYLRGSMCPHTNL
jgi:ABC-type nitrate/sulfonate/bicarbonate transport system permease component